VLGVKRGPAKKVAVGQAGRKIKVGLGVKNLNLVGPVIVGRGGHRQRRLRSSKPTRDAGADGGFSYLDNCGRHS